MLVWLNLKVIKLYFNNISHYFLVTTKALTELNIHISHIFKLITKSVYKIPATA